MSKEDLIPFKKGFDPRRNLGGAPKNSLKRFQQQMFNDMTPAEKKAFLKGVPKGERWRMAEGNPHQTTDTEHILPQTLIELINGITNNTTDSGLSKEDTE